ncbi:MAG: hypothetical protein PHD67_03355 [Oscillospiraceae bacterium]|nr:hypothetical protein [Oscillospiraceae bacterium]
MGRDSLLFKHQSGLYLTVTREHAAEPGCHMNRRVGTAGLRHSGKLAREAARLLAAPYQAGALVELILCEQGCEVVGSFLACELSGGNALSLNRGCDIRVAAFRWEEERPVLLEPEPLSGQSVLLLADRLFPPDKALCCAQWAAAQEAALSGVCALFGTPGKVGWRRVHCLFSAVEVPGFHFWPEEECPLCRAEKANP